MANTKSKGASASKDSKKQTAAKDSNQNRKTTGKRENKRFSNSGRGKATMPTHTKSMSEYIGTSNDPQWYLTNRRIVDDVFKISFANQLGSRFTLLNDNDPSVMVDETIPGIMALTMVEGPGIANDPKDGVNMALTMLYQKIREDLNTYGPYAPADVGITTIGIGDVYSQFANLLRCFGIINLFSGYNFYYPERLLQAGYGFSVAEIANIRNNLANYRARFNYIITNATRLFMPVEFSIIARHAWLYSNYFMDLESIKAQIYIHRKAGYYLFDETTDPNGGMLQFNTMPTTLKGLLDAFEASTEALIRSDSIRQIQADMRHAWNDSNTWKLAYADESYICLPNYSRDVLSQIHNLQFVPPVYNTNATYSFDIKQNVNQDILTWNPKIVVATAPTYPSESSFPLSSDKPINFHWDGHTTEDLVEATRNMMYAVPSTTSTSNDTLDIKACGADFCIAVTIYDMTASYTIDPVYVYGSTLSGTALNELAVASQFDWAPILYTCTTGSGGAVCKIIGDVGNYSKVDFDTFLLQDKNIMNSMWSVPEFGSVAGSLKS